MLCAALKKDAAILRWDHNVFLPGRYTLEDLQAAMKRSDFAVFVFAGEDIVKWRRRMSPAPRDNVVLEIGMAIGIIGHSRLSLLYSRSDQAKIPTDLSGLNYVAFDDRKSRRVGILQASEIIRQQLIAEGLRDLPGDSEAIITQKQRSKFSSSFAETCIRQVDTFAGDLSWLDADLPTYRALGQRGVRLRFLTDTPNASVVKKAKAAGMSFRIYPNGTAAKIRGCITDAESPHDAKALIAQKTALPSSANRARKPYDYRMKIYQGTKDHAAISALAHYFTTLYDKGRQL
jgi:hypothetical protein